MAPEVEGEEDRVTGISGNTEESGIPDSDEVIESDDDEVDEENAPGPRRSGRIRNPAR